MKHLETQPNTLDQNNNLIPPVKEELIAPHVHEILKLLGEDPSREGLLRTPQRVANSFSFLTQGYQIDAKEILRSAIFEEPYDEMILVRDIDIFSLCEHHLLPFLAELTLPTLLRIILSA